MKQKGSILAIDRGKKYIGCAYALEGSTVVFPIGYLLNDKGYVDNLRDIIARYRVKHIVVGAPNDERAKKEIGKFTETLSQLVATGDAIELFDEDYSSVEA
ncbi:Holliday junction resolvase RuvX [Patescibacteria group bacterium]|nr:Holliday junction resolvase RuvX [Patescibacteria group bacterium]